MKINNMTDNSVSEVKKGCSFNVSGTFTSVLQALFICMKLGICGPNQIMGWSWWWVFCPTWIGLAFALVILFIWAILTSIIKSFD